MVSSRCGGVGALGGRDKVSEDEILDMAVLGLLQCPRGRADISTTLSTPLHIVKSNYTYLS